MGIVQSNRRGPRSPRAAVVETVAPEAFEPADATVADVLAYVDAHPDEAGAVLDAELAGKARKGIIEALS